MIERRDRPGTAEGVTSKTREILERPWRLASLRRTAYGLSSHEKGIAMNEMKDKSGKGTLIVLEGIDGSGKATQAALLERALKREGNQVLRVSFPDYDSPSSALVKMYLAGDFGKDPGDVNPYAASLFYAVDRFASFRMKWKSFYEEGGIVIADRYTTSNMVHQMTKYEEKEKRNSFLDWLEATEYGELGLPRPDLVFLLDVPLVLSENLVKERAKQGGSMDIHEQHIEYLRRCHEAYQELAARYGWKRIACTEAGTLRKAEDISAELLKALHEAISPIS